MLSKTWSSGWPSFKVFRREMDELFEHFFSEAGNSHSSSSSTMMVPRIESFYHDNKWVMRLDLPGIDPQDLDLSVVGDQLTIRASREWPNAAARDAESNQNNSQSHAVRYDTFERSFSLPKGSKSDQLKASYQHGVLELTIPAPPELAGRRIPIEIGAQEEEEQLENKAA